MKVEAISKQLKKELYEIECQVAALKRRIDHANEHHLLSNKELGGAEAEGGGPS